MSKVREFALINEYNEERVLNNSTNGFFEEPDGLGFEISASFAGVQTGWMLNGEKDVQVMKTGNIVFGTDEPYTRAEEFFRYIRRSKKLKLRYTTTAGTKYIDVKITQIGKSEIGEGNWLRCPISIAPMTLWYNIIPQRIEVEEQYEDAKRYTYSYPYKYQDFSAAGIDILNESGKPAAVELEFYGPISNPVIILEQNGAEVARCEITGTAEEDERILYSSVENDIYCVLVDAAGNETNLIPGFSLQNENFLYIPEGNSTIRITADSEVSGTIMITIRRYYRIV